MRAFPLIQTRGQELIGLTMMLGGNSGGAIREDNHGSARH